MNLIRSIKYMTSKSKWRKTKFVRTTGAFDVDLYYEELDNG